jgi:hypothetical protein
MEQTNLTLKQQVILSLTKAYVEKNGINALNTNSIGMIKYFANELAKDTDEKKEVIETNNTYPDFQDWMSKKTILRLHYRYDIDTPEQLAKFDFNSSSLDGFKPNIEILQYAMNAGIKLKNYLY